MPDQEFTESLPDPNDRAAATMHANSSDPLAVKHQHLLDIYAALGITWGGDPFARIAELRKLHGAKLQANTYDSIPLFGYELVTRERIRQITQERWSEGHDDEHTDHSLAVVAAMYAVADVEDVHVVRHTPGGFNYDAWPMSWDAEWDKRDQHPRLRQLSIAGALICAEIDRLQRLADSEERWERARLRLEVDPRADI